MAKLKPYTKYKDSEIDWLGEIPEGWDVLRNLALFLERNERVEDRDFELLSVTIGKGVIKQEDVESKKDSSNQDKSKYKVTKENDIVYNKMRMWQGAVGHNKYLGMVSPAYIVLKPNREINPRYYHYLFRTKAHNSESYKEGYGIVDDQHSLRFYQFKSMYSPYPNIKTQNNIVNYLDKKSKEIDKYVKKLKKEIALLKEHRQKIISQAVTCGLDENGKLREKPEWSDGDPMPKGWKDSGVEWLVLIPEGWEVLPLKALTDYITRGNTPNYVEEGIPVVNQATFSKGYFDKQSLRFDSNRDTSRRGILKYGDILIASTGGGVLGKSYYFDEKDLYLADSHVTIIRSNRNKFHSKFVYYFFSINFDLINGILARGATNQTELQKQWLKNISLPIPPLVMQNKISNYLDEQMEYIQIELDKINEQIEFIKEYKQSLISKVVTGKIDVRNINNNLSED